MINLHGSIFFNDSTSRNIEALSSNNPKEVMEAVEKLLPKVKDEELRKELKSVSALAEGRKKLAELTKKKADIEKNWRGEKIEQHRDEVKRMYDNLPLVTAEVKRLESKLMMSIDELKNRLRKELGKELE